MGKALVASLTALTLFARIANAQPSMPYTGNDMQPYCSLVDYGLNSGALPPMARQKLLFAGYCLGQMNALLSMAQTYPYAVKSCIPTSVTTGQVLGVVVEYISQHPRERNQLFMQLAIEAVQQAWPCTDEINAPRDQSLGNTPGAPHRSVGSAPDARDQPANQPDESNLDRHGYYTNRTGQEVHQPAKSLNGQIPTGASAQCVDGDFSFSKQRSGTCSGHGGVDRWIH